MLEVQITDIEVYEKLKHQAAYSSDITHVCSFNDKMLPILLANGISINLPESEEPKRKALLTISGKNVMKLERATPDMMAFCGIRSEYDPTIPVKCMHYVDLLLRSHLVDVSSSFINLYSKLGYRSKIKELVCSSVRFSGKGKLTDFIDGDLTIMAMKFPDCRTKDIPYKQARVKIMGQGKNHTEIPALANGDTYAEALAVQLDRQGRETGVRMILRFYSRPNILNSIIYMGNTVNIACPKIGEDKDGNLMAYDPMILPDGLELHNDVHYSAPTRSIPADLYRMALYEFQCRYDFVYGEGEK